MTDTTINITIPISRQQLRDLLITAIEGGSNYWAGFSQRVRDTDLNYLSVRVTDTESPGTKRTITPEDLAVGIARLAACAVSGTFADGRAFPAAGQHLTNALGDYDAETADVVLQMTMFDDLVYG